MKLITIANFPDEENYNQLQWWWIDQALKHKGDLELELWVDYNNCANEEICRITQHHAGADFTIAAKEYLDLKSEFPNVHWSEKALHNVGFKLYNLCQETEPFIFVDADAIIFENLDHLVECSKDQPVIMVDHQRIPGHTEHIPFPFLNSGVQVVSDPSMLDFDAILDCFTRGGSRYMIPGTDQAMLFQYFHHLKYQYSHSKVGPEWNNCAGLSSGLSPCDPSGKITPTMKDNIFTSVKINHYWYNFKPWQINCPYFSRFLQETTNE